MGTLLSQPPPRTLPRFTVLAICFAIGLTKGWHQGQPWVWPWLILAAVSAGICLLPVVARRVNLMWPMALAAVTIGVAWSTIRQHHLQPNNLEVYLRDVSELVHVRGVALNSPDVRDHTAGSMASFDFRPRASYFPMRVEALIDRHGNEMLITGKVLVRVDQTVSPFHAGDGIEATGFLIKFGGPMNPGEFDYQRYARSLGQAGMLTVPRRELIVVSKEEVHSLIAGFRAWREHIHRRAESWLLSDLPGADDSQRDALLSALLLGDRGPQLEEMSETFRRTGVAHVLAISGLHLGIFAGFILMASRLLTPNRRVHGLIIIVAVLIYLLIVDVRLPILRAGIITIIAALGMMLSRRLHIGSLVSISAIGLLIWRPDQLFSPGFQLSYGVVLGLIHFSPRLRERWFGPPNQLAGSSAEMIGHWLRDALAVATVAWAIAAPITIYHFGMFSPLAVAISVVAIPFVAVLLAIGYIKIILATLLPSAAMLLGVSLATLTNLLIVIVRGMDALPGSVLYPPRPPAVWAIVTLTWVCLVLGQSQRYRKTLWTCGAALVLWLIWPLLPVHVQPSLRIDMLAVGNGSCFLIRSPGHTIVFDAGSTTSLNAGRRRIVPALRELDVHSIDAIIISHPNLDHYSAVLELADEFNVEQVFVTPQFFDAAQRDEAGPLGYLLDELTQRFIHVRRVTAGEVHCWGEMTLNWLHPRSEATFERVNDGSMVIRIEAAGRAALLCGDIQRRAMTMLIESGSPLEADVMELPHHGSFHDAAMSFIQQVDPQIVLQSTGWRRWREDRWRHELENVERLVTARDGACWVEVRADGSIQTGRFLQPD